MQTPTRRPAMRVGVLVASLLALSGISVAAQDAESARVRVLHASPDAPAVDVYTDGSAVLEGAGFGSISGYLEVPAGDHRIQVFAASADPAVDAALIDATLTFGPGTRTTVAATNDLESIEAQVIADTPAPVADAVLIRVGHLSADTPAIDVAPEAGAEIVQGLAYPDVTDYLTIAEGALDLEFRPSGAVDGWVALDPGGVLLTNGNSYSLFLIGSLADGSVRLVTAPDGPPAPPAPALVRVLHGSPDAPAVDVLVDGTVVLAGVAFGQISDHREFAAGTHRLEIVATGADPAVEDALIDVTLAFAPGSRTTVAATGEVAAIAAQVIADLPPAPTDEAQLRVVHLAPGTPSLALALDGKRPLIKRLAHPRASRVLTVDPDRYDFELRLAAEPATVVLDLAPITLEAGTSSSLFVVGSAADETLRVVAAQDAAAAP